MVPARISTEVFKTNDWDQPEIQYSTGASNQVRHGKTGIQHPFQGA
jgi:hypothetical protein